MKHKDNIVAFITENGASKTTEIAKLLDLSEVRARTILRELVAEGRIATSGETKRKIYFLKKR